ncbi:MAG: ATP-dependent helicase/nuclease subunit A, partial [Planctomycetota bacterium]
MNPVPHQLILASAGTGKTFRLTNQFLGLLFRGVAPERILATTFTRKAAGEILDRVLERLVKGADDEAECQDLAEKLDLPNLQPSDCLALLAKLTKDIDSFCVRTIDAFFLGMVQLFALDLGLPPTWSIAGARLDNRLQSDALQDALRDSSPDELLELLRDLNEGSVSRSVHKSMLERASKLRPIYLESSEAAWNWLVPTADVSDDDFDAALAAFATTQLPVTKAGGINKTFQKGWLKLELVARASNWMEVFKSGLCAKVMEGLDMYSRVELTEEFMEVIEPILQRASHRWLADLVTRNKATYDLLDRFESAYEERKLSYGAFQFNDLPLALAPRNSEQSPLDERELDMWFRMDGRVDHLLLDEFQDTSPIQWRILEHIASEIASDGTGERSFFCVGDVKQSIYGFRQAEPRLLANLHNMLPGLVPERMDKSYRSSQTVLEMVNLVFEKIENNGAFRHDELGAYRLAGREWQAGFDTHRANNLEMPGAALLFEARANTDEEDAYEAVLDLTVERVVALTAEAPQAEIGILLRLRKYIPTLILRLKQHGISASGEGGNELVDSAAVLVYISLLHLADHPDDSAAAFHVASSRFGAYVGLKQGADLETRREFSRLIRLRLTNEGLGRVTADLALQVAADDSWSHWDRTRFTQLLGQAFSFESEMGLRPSDFVDHLR